MTKWVSYPMVILWSSYGDPMVRVGFGRYRGGFGFGRSGKEAARKKKIMEKKRACACVCQKKSCTFAAVFNLRYSARTCIYMDFESPTLLHSGVGGR